MNTITCGLTGIVLFKGCPVLTCMWSSSGGSTCTRPITAGTTAGATTTADTLSSATAGDDNDKVSADSDLLNSTEAKRKLDLTIAVGLYIEAHSGKAIFDIREKDIPPYDAFRSSIYGRRFLSWLTESGYNKTIKLIKTNL